MKVIVLGAGAAGFFAALSCKQFHPEAEVTLLEGSSKVLAKVKVSGGGRCNVTNAMEGIPAFSENYPRGGRLLRKVFSRFNNSDTVQWFESRGVKIKTEPDGRMFPVSNNSQDIIDCLLSEMRKSQVQLITGAKIVSVKKNVNQFELTDSNQKTYVADKLIVATGGSAKIENYHWLTSFGHTIVPPVPSLFTFNIPNTNITSLMGISVPTVSIKIQGKKLKQEGPLLITHWGFSGPAVLKLSAWGARELFGLNYSFQIQVNWTGNENEHSLNERINEFMPDVLRKKVTHLPVNRAGEKLTQIPSRLWTHLTLKCGIGEQSSWNELSKDKRNRLVNAIINDEYHVQGKTTFKEEFVTCGGVDLHEVDFNSMQSKKCTGLFFAGEVLDVDGVTGGFNFQAAWSTGFVAGMLT